ncbi:MAG: sulfurtransferase TusA family protein [Sphingobium sp.]
MPPNDDPVRIDARGMKCPWPALRAARAMRSAQAVAIEADDPIADRELAAMAHEQGWTFEAKGAHLFLLSR